MAKEDKAKAWTVKRVKQLGLTTDLETAADILGIGRTMAYELVRNGEFPVEPLLIGRKIRIPVYPLLTLLRVPSDDTAE